MMKQEFENLIGKEVSDKDYEVIDRVYTFHPAISETEGKKQIADNGKKWVMFEDKQCAAGEVKLTDGFKDKLIRWNSDKLIGMESISKEEIDLRKVVKRMRGARPWHPLLQTLRKELEG